MGNIILDVVFLLVGVGIILICAKRGFLKTVIHFFRTILSFVLAYLLGGKLAQLLCDLWIGGAVHNAVFDKINGLYQGAVDSFDAEQVIASLPDFLMTESMKESLHAAEGSGAELVGTMTDAIASPIASLFSNILGYIGVFLIAYIGLFILSIVLNNLIKHIHFVKVINTVLGAVLGLLISLTVLFAVSSLLKFFFANSDIYTNSVIVKFFGESSLLDALKFLNIGHSWFAELLGA